jgi:long-chain fatty acid transport protein
MRTKIIAAAAALLPTLALANGYDAPSVTPRDLALVESATAAQNDAGATYANPAALSRVKGLSLNLAGSYLDLTTTWSAPEGSVMAGSPDATTKKRPVPPVSLYAAYGFDIGGQDVGVGLGMNLPGGGNVFYQDDWAGRGRIITVDRKVYGFYLTGGVEVSQGLRLGGGLVYYYTTEYLKQGIQPSDASYGELSTKGGAPSFDLSADWTPPIPTLPLTFAVDFKYKAKQTLKGDGNFVVPNALLLPSASDPTKPAPVDQNVTHELTYPSVLNVGVAYRPPVQGLQLTFVYTWNGYSVYKDDTFVGEKGTTIVVPRNYGDGQVFRLGAEYEATPKLTLRAGVLRDLSGFKTDTYSPTLPDGNSWAGAVGAAWKFGPDLSIAGTFFYDVVDEVKTTGTTVMPGVYNTNTWIVALGLNWRTDLAAGK